MSMLSSLDKGIRLNLFLLGCFLRNNPIKFINCQWIDYAGILRTCTVTTLYLRSLAKDSFAIRFSPIALTSSTIHEFMQDLVPTGVDFICPDFSSLRPCRYEPGYAGVMCSISEGIGDFGFKRCPRTILNKTISSAVEVGLEIKVGFEVEFRCLNTDGTDLEDCLKGWSTAAGQENRCIPIIREILKILEQSRIKVEKFHTEGAQGMFEISTGPLPALQAIDAWVYTRETIKKLFSKQNILATLYPSPTPEHHGIGAHVHLSIGKATSDSFLAGILTRLPALCAFSLPLEESYNRVNDKSEAGAYVTWGTENRDVPIRQIRNGYWEVRCCDATANMYLMVAAFIAAGIEEGEELVWEDCLGCPSRIDEEGRALLRITKPLPKTLSESLQAMEEVNWSKLGMEAAATRYAEIKRQELISGVDSGKKAYMLRLF